MDFKPLSDISVVSLRHSSQKDYDLTGAGKPVEDPELIAAQEAHYLESLKVVSDPAPMRKKGKKKGKKMQPPKGKIIKASKYSCCASTHPPLPLGDGMEVWGGSCTRQQPEKPYDVIIGLDYNMVVTKASYPWTDREEFLFKIQDMSVPKDKGEFDKLIDHMESRIRTGNMIFVGCIGGHGRTGLVLSVLAQRFLGIDDATTYVRKNYCKKAVESQSQVDWLFKNYGIKKVKATKDWGGGLRDTAAYETSFGKGYPGWSGGGESLSDSLTPVKAPGRVFGLCNVE